MILNKKTRAIASCLLIVLILPIFAGCVISAPEEETEEGLYISGEGIDLTVPESGSYFYAQLNDAEKMIYASSLAALEMGENEFELAGVDCDEYEAACQRATKALLRDHPEYFWLDGGYRMKTTKVAGEDEGTLRVTLTTHAYWSAKDLSSARKELDVAVSELIAAANEFSDPYEKVKFVNDWLSDNVEYDDASFLDPAGMTDDANAFVNTLYGTLVERKTLCGGYAYTFAYIMNHVGIETLYITGTTVDGLHAWNAVRLGDEYYYIDVTWADDNRNEKISYAYFCLDREEMSRTHNFDDLFVYPDSDGTEYNYFLREGLYLESYSFNKYNELFSAHYVGKAFSVKFSDEVALNEAVRDIIDNSKFYKLDGISNAGTFSYFIDRVHYILTIYP